jgi:hypothetical protein
VRRLWSLAFGNRQVLLGVRPSRRSRSAVGITPLRGARNLPPQHLAERILTSKAALEGERKQVTVLFGGA